MLIARGSSAPDSQRFFQSIELWKTQMRAPALTAQLPLRCSAHQLLHFAFAEPRAYSRFFSGLSVLLFLRAVRLVFLRSSLLKLLVFAINPLVLI